MGLRQHLNEENPRYRQDMYRGEVDDDQTMTGLMGTTTLTGDEDVEDVEDGDEELDAEGEATETWKNGLAVQCEDKVELYLHYRYTPTRKTTKRIGIGLHGWPDVDQGRIIEVFPSDGGREDDKTQARAALWYQIILSMGNRAFAG